MATTTSVYVDPNTGGVQAGVMQFRNGIINGDMRINQRGTSTNLTAMTAIGTTYGYVCDRWGVYRQAYQEGAQVGQGIDVLATDKPFSEAGISTFGRIGRVAGNTSTVYIALAYGMESVDSTRYLGQNVTLSFYYRTGVQFNASSLAVTINTGTAIDEGMQRGAFITGQTSISASVPTSTLWTKYSITTRLNTTFKQIGFNIIYTPTSTAGASDYFDVTGFQFEKGAVSTLFEFRPYLIELQLCQRYYEKEVIQIASTFTAANPTGGVVKNYGQTIFYKVSKRKLPTLTGYIDNISSNFNKWFGGGVVVLSWDFIGLNSAVPISSTTALAYGTYDINAEL